MNRLWKSDRSKSCTRTLSASTPSPIDFGGHAYVDELLLPLLLGATSLVLEHDIVVPSARPSAVVAATLPRSAYRRLTLKSLFGCSNGLPSAMSFSRCASSSAAFSASCWLSVPQNQETGRGRAPTSRARCSALSFLIFSSSRINTAVSSSSSLGEFSVVSKLHCILDLPLLAAVAVGAVRVGVHVARLLKDPPALRVRGFLRVAILGGRGDLEPLRRAVGSGAALDGQGRARAARLLGEVRGLGGQELGAEVPPLGGRDVALLGSPAMGLEHVDRPANLDYRSLSCV